MASIAAVARDFFEACEAGKGWEVCRAYCTPDAGFSAQAEPLAELRTLYRAQICHLDALRDGWDRELPFLKGGER